MLVTMVVTALIETMPVGPAPMACSFHGPESAPVEIVMQGRPSLKDQPGFYRVAMHVDGRDLNAAAQPIAATEGRDILIRAKRGTDTFYAIGIDDQGAAALNIVWGQVGEEPERRATLTGTCRNHERYIRRWAID